MPFMHMKRTTGYRDIHGREIYEGDYIRAKYEYLFQVYYDTALHRWMITDETGHYRMELARVVEFCERENR